MGYTVLGHGICPDCSGKMVQFALGTDVNGEDDYAGVGWFHVIGPGEVQELCPAPLVILCVDCGTNVIGSDHYMVSDELWAAAGADRRDHLCVTCLEKRLGRPLAATDLADLPINRPGLMRDCDRLAALKSEAFGGRS